MNWRLTDTGETLALNLENATLTHVMGKQDPVAAASVTTTRAALEELVLKRTSPAAAMDAGILAVEGDPQIPPKLFAMLDDFEMMFDIVTPGNAD